MSIYTKTGDDGKTSLYRGKRLLKSCSQVDAYGSIDELVSFIGLIINKNNKTKKILTGVQKDLYQIMGFLAGSNINLSFLNERVVFFEEIIDRLSKKLPVLKNFILPQGTEISCWFHVVRTVCRRTERTVVLFYNQPPNTNLQSPIIKYLNRLSDLFFTFARHYNNQKEVVIIK